MARPFIEFLQSQQLDWRVDPQLTGRQEVEAKLLSQDDTTGATTLLVRYPAGWTATSLEWCNVDEEFFVLLGEVVTNGRQYTRHHYAYWPSGFVRQNFKVGPEGATLVVMLSGRPQYSADPDPRMTCDVAALTEQVDPFRLIWDRTNMDANIAHLNAWRKNLRLSPNGKGRTYLLAGLPQGFPESGEEPLERHPHVEEMFMISGDMPCSLGIMRAGAYFWRPPEIWHGADCTVNGFLLLARTPGTNVTVSEWSERAHPVLFDPQYRPQLPDNLKEQAHEFADPIIY